VKLSIRLAAALLISGAFGVTANAQLYWDIDTISQAGAGGATPAGTWDTGITANWNINSDGTGVPGVWTDGSDAIFAAGTDATGSYAVTLGGTVSANSLSFDQRRGNVGRDRLDRWR
jgi:hypothetical protein